LILFVLALGEMAVWFLSFYFTLVSWPGQELSPWPGRFFSLVHSDVTSFLIHQKAKHEGEVQAMKKCKGKFA
jgi:hypothetical protein